MTPLRASVPARVGPRNHKEDALSGSPEMPSPAKTTVPAPPPGMRGSRSRRPSPRSLHGSACRSRDTRGPSGVPGEASGRPATTRVVLAKEEPRMGPVELVRRAGEEVAIQGLDVNQVVRGIVDGGQRTPGRGPVGDPDGPGHVGDGPEGVRDRADRQHLRPIRDLRLQIVPSEPGHPRAASRSSGRPPHAGKPGLTRG